MVSRTTSSPKLFITAMSLASGAVWLAMSDVAILIPTLQEQLGASFSQMQWIASVAFTLTITPLLVPAGRLADRAGPKHVVLVGMAIFAGFSVVAIVPEVWVMTLARAGQGVGAALVVSASLSGLATDLPMGMRGLGVAIWGTTAAVLQGLGPTFGGVLASAGLWQGVFLVNIPVALLVWWALSRSAVAADAQRRPWGDRSGTMLLACWTIAVTIALVQGPSWGWTSPATVGAMGVGVITFVGFVVVELRSTDPLLDLRLFRSRGLSGSVVLNFSNNAVFVAFTFLMSLYLQVALGYSAMEAGSFFVAASGAALVTGPFTDRLVSRVGLSFVAIGGALVSATGLLAVTRLSPGSSAMVGVLAFVLIGCGVATIANSSAIGMSVSVGESEEGAASGVFNTGGMLASSLGVVAGSLVFGAIAMRRFTDAIAETGAQVGGASSTEIEYLVTGEATEPIRDSLVSPEVADLAVDSFAGGIAWTMAILALALVVSSAVSALMLRGQSGRSQPRVTVLDESLTQRPD